MANQKNGGGSRKLGRNKKRCEAYKNRRQREKNKESKLFRHLKNHPNDTQAEKAMEAL